MKTDKTNILLSKDTNASFLKSEGMFLKNQIHSLSCELVYGKGKRQKKMAPPTHHKKLQIVPLTKIKFKIHKRGRNLVSKKVSQMIFQTFDLYDQNTYH